MELTLDERRVLGALAANPWMPCGPAAVYAGLPVEATQRAIAALARRRYVTGVSAPLPAPPRTLYAASRDGVLALAGGREALLRSLRTRMQLSARRYTWLRIAREITIWTNELCAASARAARVDGYDGRWQTLVPRKRRKSQVMLHGRLMFERQGKVQAWHVLVDPGWGDALRYRSVMQYLGAWQLRHKHAHPESTFPGLLVISTDAYRVGMLLGLAETYAPRVACAVSADWGIAMRRGVQAARWWARLVNGASGQVNPFVRASIPRADFEASPFRLADAAPQLKAYGKPYSVQWLARSAGETEQKANALDADGKRIANALSRHPGMHQGLLAEACRMHAGQVTQILARLETAGLARRLVPEPHPTGWAAVKRPDADKMKKFDLALYVRVKAKPGCTAHDLALSLGAPQRTGARCNVPVPGVRRVLAGLMRLERAGCVRRVPATGFDGMWQMDEAYVKLRALEQGNDELVSARRHGFFARTFARHGEHTRATYDVLERVYSYVRRRSLADYGSEGVGKLIVTAIGSECSHTRGFTYLGARRAWRPDGYIAVRFNGRTRDYWIEMASFNAVRETRSEDNWREKFDALCAYRMSGAWRLSYVYFPVLLIVAHDLAERETASSVLADVARVHQLTGLPEVWMTTRKDFFSGLLSSVPWHDLVHGQQGTPFAGFGALASVVSRVPDLVGQLLAAEEAGVIDAAVRAGALMTRSAQPEAK